MTDAQILSDHSGIVGGFVTTIASIPTHSNLIAAIEAVGINIGADV